MSKSPLKRDVHIGVLDLLKDGKNNRDIYDELHVRGLLGGMSYHYFGGIMAKMRISLSLPGSWGVNWGDSN